MKSFKFKALDNIDGKYCDFDFYQDSPCKIKDVRLYLDIQDKTGKWICEGDIVRSDSGEEYTIIYDHCRFMLEQHGKLRELSPNLGAVLTIIGSTEYKKTELEQLIEKSNALSNEEKLELMSNLVPTHPKEEYTAPTPKEISEIGKLMGTIHSINLMTGCVDCKYAKEYMEKVIDGGTKKIVVCCTSGEDKYVIDRHMIDVGCKNHETRIKEK